MPKITYKLSEKRIRNLKNMAKLNQGNTYRLGGHHTEEAKRKIGEAQRNRKRYPFTEEHKRKISEALIGHKNSPRGEDSPMWKGGISFEPYPVIFNRELKELIRQRDNFQCQLCGMPECENIFKLDIHHIDYDKNNCLPSNLIALCKKCNAIANHGRTKWTKYFKKKLNDRY